MSNYAIINKETNIVKTIIVADENSITANTEDDCYSILLLENELCAMTWIHVENQTPRFIQPTI
jgi:hypothetical protein